MTGEITKMFTNFKKRNNSYIPIFRFVIIHWIIHWIPFRIWAQGQLNFMGAAPHFCMEDVTYSDMKVLGYKLREHGLKVLEINPENCAYPVNLASGNSATRARTLRYYENAIHTAGVISAKYVLIFPGYPNADDNPEDAWKTFRGFHEPIR